MNPRFQMQRRILAALADAPTGMSAIELAGPVFGIDGPRAGRWKRQAGLATTKQAAWDVWDSGNNDPDVEGWRRAVHNVGIDSGRRSEAEFTPDDWVAVARRAPYRALTASERVMLSRNISKLVRVGLIYRSVVGGVYRLMPTQAVSTIRR